MPALRPAPAPPAQAPDAIAARFTFGAAPLVGQVTVFERSLIAADRAGRLAAVDADGRLIWSLETAVKPGDSSYPVRIGSRLYYGGGSELLVVNLFTGQLLKRVALERHEAQPFGARIASDGERGLLSTSRGLQLFDLESGDRLRELPVASGTRATPAVEEGRAYVASQRGSLVVLDLATGRQLASVTTKGLQPVASSVVLAGGRTYFAGRRGTVVCVDASRGEVVWQQELGVEVFSDLAVGGPGVYAFGGGRLHALAAGSGQPLWPALEGVSCPPLLAGDRLYVGMASGEFVALDAATGRRLGGARLPEAVTTRPAGYGQLLAVGTAAGSLYLIDPRGLQP